MKLGEIIAQARRELDDTAAPYLWSDDELQVYANEAEAEAARRARLLIDSTTSAITQKALAPGDSTVTLDARIVSVRRAKLASQDRPLARTVMREIDAHLPGWEAAPASVPQAIITDYETGKLRLYPPSAAADTLKLTVIRLPLAEMNDDEDAPEIHARFHLKLIHWIKHRAWLKNDPDTYDEKSSEAALKMFEAEFGQRSSAIDETWIEREQMGDAYDGTY